MRLLQYNSLGQLRLTKDLIGDDIPEYAILSHTWGADTEEVTFRDLIGGTGKSKAGYNKIRFCGEQAKRKGLKYFWVDTCCIDKSNSVELQEAINSMFRWYQKAAKCYVYLTDVSTNEHDEFDPSVQSWESAFRRSRWFTRGWTLQELVAPRSVEFFCSNGKRLGDKKSLEGQLQEITGIAVSALQGSALFKFSIAERMSWAEKRETKREEDKAYSLLGIFDIYMPLIYGEGIDNAFRRLCKEIEGGNSLNSLPFAVDAPFNSYQRQHEPTCLDNTRVDILHDIYIWANGQDKRCIFWLNGLAGTGKSTIARTVARRYFEKNRLGASFFFTKGGGDVGHAGKFVTSVAIQLANSVPTFRRYICDAIAERSDITNQSLRDQWHQLVLRPLSNLDGNNCYSSYVLVVDALDECNDDSNIRIILQLLAEAQLMQKVQLRVFLTSRPEIPIRYGFNQIPDTEHQDFALHNISPSIVDHDISIFLEYNLRLIGQERSLDACEEVVKYLVQIAGGLFIWAATACRFIREGKRFAAKRLDTILEGSGSVTAPEKHLDEIYITVLKHSITLEYTDKEKEEFYYILRHILGSIAVLFSPLSAHSLSRLLRVTKEDIDQTLEDLHSVLDVPKNQNRPLRLHHPSFRDFLLNNNRCKDPNFWVDEKQAHQTLTNSCIHLMSTFLKQDICSFNTPGVLVSDAESSRVERSLPPEVQYACLYWIQHFRKSGARLCDDDQVHQFLQKHLLHWLEALGWMRKISEGIYAIASLESVAAVCDCPRLSEFVHDTKRFVLYNRPAIEQAPFQTYCSALVFAPAMSIVRKQFKDCVPQWMRRPPEVESNWNALLQTLEGHSDSVIAVAFSPDGKLLASASYDKTVRLWDVGSGAALQTLECHSVNAVAFSPDGKLLASVSRDKMVKLWDTDSAAALQILEGHLDSVGAMAFSPDGKLLASILNDTTVKLWDASSGTTLQILKGHSSLVNAVAFSPDGKLLASVSKDKTVKLWDTSSGAALQILEGHLSSVRAVAFSPDGKLLASASSDKTVKLWDANSGAALQILEGHLDSVGAVAFSPDSKLLASVSSDTTVKLWDTGSGAALQTLKGHSSFVNAVAFSPDGKLLASASYDKTIKLWDTGLGAALQTLKGHSSFVSAVAFSPNGKLLASASNDTTVKLWDARSGTTLQILKGHSSLVNAVAFSPDGKLIASASYDTTVKLWNASSGAALQIFEGHLDFVSAVAFSPNGKLLASASRDKIVKLWDVGSGALLYTLKGHLDFVNTVAFSPNSKLLASASYNKTIKLWDTGSGAVLQTLKGHLDFVSAVAFSPDGKLLMSASNDETIKLWDAGSGVALQTFELDTVVDTLLFSNDGTFVQTNRGPLHNVFLSDGPAVSLPNIPRSIFIKERWVSLDMENLLWLPSDYRLSCVAVRGSIVAFGCESGRVSFMEFAL